jgi:hypothetical protein
LKPGTSHEGKARGPAEERGVTAGKKLVVRGCVAAGRVVWPRDGQ